MAKIHRCVGDPQECESPAKCERCGRSATPEIPVVVESAEDETWEYVCEVCKSHEPIEMQTNPETGADAGYPAWAKDGRPVSSWGTVERCVCETCVARTAARAVRLRKEFVWG